MTAVLAGISACFHGDEAAWHMQLFYAAGHGVFQTAVLRCTCHYDTVMHLPHFQHSLLPPVCVCVCVCVQEKLLSIQGSVVGELTALEQVRLFGFLFFHGGVRQLLT